MRPTLKDVADDVLRGEPFDFCLRNFLDDFRAQPAAVRLSEEPARLAGHTGQGALYDAFLAATAETLAAEFNLPPPAWTWDEQRRLHRPWFAVPWAGMRALLLLESPAPFRSRNLFVSANALSRA